MDEQGSNVVPLRPQRLDDAYAAVLGEPRVQAAIKRVRQEERLIALGMFLRRIYLRLRFR